MDARRLTSRRLASRRLASRTTTAALLATAALTLAGCAGTTASGGGRLRIVAAENFWGSIAMQLAGSRASTQSLIVDPAQDPHSYEPKAADARTLATAQLAIVNGVGYDPWMSRLLAANPASGRLTLNVGDVLHLHAGDNPHRWYSPSDVSRVADTITADLRRLDPTDATYFDNQRVAFAQRGLGQYHALIAQIRRRYAGIAIGASESIFALQAPALGLRLITPPSFMKAISEGADVAAADILATQRQITGRQIKVWIFNSQNATPQIGRLNSSARAAGIPIVPITETLSPAPASFEQWQVAQLQRLGRALHAVAGR